MNDDEWFINVLRDHTYQRSVGSSLNTQQVYDMLRQLEMYSKKDNDMAYTYSRGSCDEVATAVLEAYAKGIDFEILLKTNVQVRAYWNEIHDKKVKKAQARERAIERDRKLAEKRAIEQAKREEAMQKLTPEELEAFGFKAKGKR